MGTDPMVIDEDFGIGNNDDDIENCIIITTRDEKEHRVPKDIIQHFETVQNVLDDTEDSSVVLPNIDSEILEIVVDFTRRYIQNQNDADDSWKWEFFDMYPNYIKRLTLAADYLDFAYFLDLCTTRCAHLFETTSPDIIQKTFGFINDFTPEEKSKIEKETSWSEILSPAYWTRYNTTQSVSV